MISDYYKLIFVHSRKCAGSSIVSVFPDAQKKFDDGLMSSGFRVKRQEIYRNYVVFTVCRHPFDRLLSSWRYCHSTKNLSLYEALRNPPSSRFRDDLFSSDRSFSARKESFAYFLKRTLSIIRSGQRLKTSKFTHDYRHFTQNQTDLYVDENGGGWADYVLRLEFLESDWTAMWARLGYAPPALPHLNAGINAKEHWGEIMSKEEVELATELFAKDFYYLPYSPCGQI